jgi:hypothetical protein
VGDRSAGRAQAGESSAALGDRNDMSARVYVVGFDRDRTCVRLLPRFPRPDWT